MDMLTSVPKTNEKQPQAVLNFHKVRVKFSNIIT